MIKVLIVDDSALVRKLFGKVLSSDPEFEVHFARHGAEALQQLDSLKPDVITLDIHMPEMDGLECLDRIMVQRPCPVVMVSSLTADGAEITLDALRLGATDFIAKPDGAVSLSMDEFAPLLVAKIRLASKAKLKASTRLRERIQFRNDAGMPRAPYVGVKKAPPLRRANNGIVLVGTSTGGPPALEVLLTGLPATFAWPIVIAQHMPASFTGPLARRLNQLSALNVVEIVRPTTIASGSAYIGKGDHDVIISRKGSTVVAAPVPAGDYPWHPSTDRLVRSALECLRPDQLVGILMTGMGNDGAEAMTRLRALGGCTIAEAEETAVVWGMPGELAKAGGADWVLPLNAIASKLEQVIPAHAADP